MGDAFLYKSMFTWYKEMNNRDQPVSDETIAIAAQAICQQMNQPDCDVTSEWVSKFKDRYGIRTEVDTVSRPPSLWRPKGASRRKLSDPAPSQELLDRRARLGKSYAIDEDSDHEEKMQVGRSDSDDSLCGFSFEELSSVPEYKPFCCEHCSERYLWGHQLKEHMKCHSDVRKYLCTSCGKNYKSPHNLKIHMRVHTGDRPYVCGTCKKGFREHSALVKHRRIHTGERPFLCSDCGSAFISKTQLNIHSKTHQSENGGDPSVTSSSPVTSEKRKRYRTSSRATPIATSAEEITDHLASYRDVTELRTDTSALSEENHLPGNGIKTSAINSSLTPTTAVSTTPLPPMNHLLPGTGYYIPITSAGSISSGTPMQSTGGQYESRVVNTSPSGGAPGSFNSQGPPGVVDLGQQQQLSVNPEFMQNISAQAYYEDYYYNS